VVADIDTVEVTISVLPISTVTLGVNVSNAPSDYPSISISPSTVKIAGAQDTLDKIEKFDLNDNALAATDDILKEFGVETVLATWLVHDGYGFSAEPKVVDLDGYKAYWMEKHIYLIEPGLSDKGISALFDKFETEGSFNPGNVVVFGYSFSWTQLEALKNNLLKIAANGTNKHVLLDKRY
jgi:type III restriction enzyme/adenine-specific DNA-methyltransferase